MEYALVKKAFRDCPRFQGIEDEFLALLFWRAEERTARSGERIYEEGSTSDNTLALLVNGELDIFRDGVSICKISPFEVFGEIAYFEIVKLRTSTVVVASPTASYLLFRIYPEELKAGPFAELGKRLSIQAWETFVKDAQREM